MKRFLASAAIIFSLSACASVLESASEDITVLTPGAQESVCFLDNGQTVYRQWPPESVKVSKRPGELKVRCLADGNREQTVVIPADHEDVTLANGANGFLPGMFVDYNTGAMFAYPHTITVDFSGIPPSPMPQPAYERYLMENPDLFGMEEFRPGEPALMQDKYNEPYVLQRREIPGSFSGTAEGGAQTESGGAESPAATGTGGSASNAPPAQPSSDMVSDLTRRMNPHVFGPSDQGPPTPEQSFIGGTTSPSSSGGNAGDGSVGNTGPVSLYPAH